MPRTVKTPDDFARVIGAAIDEAQKSSAGRRALVRRKMRTVLSDAGGWSRRGSANVQQIIDALDRHEIHADWTLHDERLSLDSYIWFARHPIRRRDVGPSPFRTERELIGFIVENYQDLFRRAPELRDLRLVGSEVRHRLTRRGTRPDILFENSAGKTVVVEVELGDPQENSAFQLRKYMTDSRAVLGVLMTARPSSADLEALTQEALDDMAPRKPTIWLWHNFGLKKVSR